MIAPARVAAYDALLAVSGGRADLPSAIARARGSLSDERDRALATDIATGVQRWRAALDHLIVHFARRTLDRLDPEIVEILRLGIYQLLHLTRVPAAAVVDDAVSLAKRARKTSASGLVNAVLRAVSRGRQRLPLPARPGSGEAEGARRESREEVLDYLSITLSHPRWLAERWLDRLGFETAEAWLLFNNTAPSLTLRTNVLRTTTEHLQELLRESGVATTRGRFAPDALLVEHGNPLNLDEEHLAGQFVVQDEASQLVTLLAGAHPGLTVLDTCASPGGKATALAALLPEGGRLVACDVRERRMQLLKRTIRAAGADGVALVQADLLAPLPFARPFSTVIVDAPCSGLGTLRRDPDIKWRRKASDLAALAERQSAMLDHAAAVVAPHGRLVYATCSSEPEENDEVVEAFLQRTHGWQRVDARVVHPLLPPSVVDGNGWFRTTPDRHGLEAFFGVVFEKQRPV
jgi:16S rRNA (cytosine967-C5)-methyltransferase